MEEKVRTKYPDLEAEIYYLTHEEGGRLNAIGDGYRGQFYYDGRDWDARQEFLGQSLCEPGETINVKMDTLSPDFHVGRFWEGKEFQIREGNKVVGQGKITRIVRDEFNSWNYDSVIKNFPNNCIPYGVNEVNKYIETIKKSLEVLSEIEEVNCIVDLSNQNEMIIVKCKLTKGIKSPRPMVDNVCKLWRKEISLDDYKFKTELKNNILQFELSFITWQQMYLTGKIIVEK